MNVKYTATIVMILAVLALSRGFVAHYHDFISFDALSAFAQGEAPSASWELNFYSCEPGDILAFNECPPGTSITHTTLYASYGASLDKGTYNPGEKVQLTLSGNGNGSDKGIGESATLNGVEVANCQGTGQNLCSDQYFNAPDTPGSYTIALSGCWANSGNCAKSSLTFTVSQPTVQAPTFTLHRSPTTVSQGQTQSVAWETANATSLSWTCTGNGNHSLASEVLQKDSYDKTWDELYNTLGFQGQYSCTWTVSGPGGTADYPNDNFNIVPPTPPTPPTTPAPTITINRSPTTVSQGQSQTMSWSTTNATSLSWSCVGSGNHGLADELLQKTSYNKTWDELYNTLGYQGQYSCTWTAVGPGGTTVHPNDNFNIVPPALVPPPAVTCTTETTPVVSTVDCITHTAYHDVKVCSDGTRTDLGWRDGGWTGTSCSIPNPPIPPEPTCTLIATPETIEVGGSATLSWTTNRTDPEIGFTIGNIGGTGKVNTGSGSMTVSPTVTTEYIGVVIDNFGFSPRQTGLCTATVTVIQPPPPPSAPLCTLTANPTNIQRGGSSVLSWSISNNPNGYEFYIDNGVGVVSNSGFPQSGSNTVSPTVTTTYVGTMRPVGLQFSPPPPTYNCSATIVVTPIPPNPATIKVTKVVINNNGGTKTISNFPLFVDTTSVVSGVANTFAPGTYTVSETNLPNYTATFSGDCSSSGNVTIAAGQNKVCTITNDDNPVPPNPATIKVVKVVINNNGGTKTISNFPLFVDTTSVVSGVANTFAPGTYTVSETNLPNYTATFSGDCNSSGSITISAGQNKVCTITNDDIAVQPQPVCTLVANPTSVKKGFASSLSWTTKNATSFTINQAIGEVMNTSAGSVSVTPQTTTTYTGTATGPGGSVTCSAIVTVTTSPPPPPVLSPTCVLTASPTEVSSGSTSTLSWTTTNSVSFSINTGIGNVLPILGGSTTTPTISSNTTFTGTATNSAGSTVTCNATVTIKTAPPPPPGCTSNCGGGGGGCTSNCGGGGGGSPEPKVVLSSLPHVGVQSLAYLYLSQIPQTGLELGPLGTTVYWLSLIMWALALAYLVLFGAAPFVNRRIREFGVRISEVLNAQPVQRQFAHSAVAPEPVAMPLPVQEHAEAPRGYSSYDGFKSFARGGALSIDDIVKGLARSHPSHAVEKKVEDVRNVEPIYQQVEPVYENVEPIEMSPVVESEPASIPANTRGFVSALVEGDRVAVFAGLRQHLRGGGSPEQLISPIVCLLDDAYRSRIDGTPCDADVVRMTARLNTPVLEKLIASLTNAIDSSYTTGATGAKLALTRALAVLGA